MCFDSIHCSFSSLISELALWINALPTGVLCSKDRPTRLDSEKNGTEKKKHGSVSNQTKGDYNYLTEVKGQRLKKKGRSCLISAASTNY